MSSSAMTTTDLTLLKAYRFLFKGNYRYRAAYGGRGSGKSHSFAAALILKARERPVRVLCCREIQKSIRDSVKRLLDDKIKACGFQNKFISTETEIRGTNGSLFIFGGLRTNPDQIKSLEGVDIAWVEEADRISNRSLELLIPTIRKPDSEIWFSWNPGLPTDPVDDMFRGNSPKSMELKAKGQWERDPRAIVRKVGHKHNMFFPPVLREEMEWDCKRDPDKYAHVWLGEYRRSSEARVFHNWRVEDFETPTNVKRFYLGADFGFSIDPTVLVRCYIDGRNLYVDHEVWSVKCEIDRTPALFDKVPGARAWPMIADSANPQSISYLLRNGFEKIRPARKGPGSVEEGVEFLKSFDIVVNPRCRHVIDELTLYSYEIDEHTGEVLPKLADKKNHTIDALRYAVEGERRYQESPIVIPFVTGQPRHIPGQ